MTKDDVDDTAFYLRPCDRSGGDGHKVRKR